MRADMEHLPQMPFPRINLIHRSDANYRYRVLRKRAELLNLPEQIRIARTEDCLPLRREKLASTF